jgi:isoaspartyl peptidase/L-asparaginase-like protein (Ntn-hydrolase superfamily)
VKPAKAGKPAAVDPREQQKAQQTQRKSLQKRVQKLEGEVAALEARKAAVVQQLEDPAVWQDGERAALLSRELEATEASLAAASSAWLSAASELEQIEQQAAVGAGEPQRGRGTST